jgi:Glycosyl transferase family 2
LEDHEVVAVDDGSRDGSHEVLERAAVRDRRVRILRGEPSGLAAALNAAVREARAPLVARMDADDRAHPERLRLQANALDLDPGLHVLGARVRLFGGASNAGMQAYVDWSNGLLDDVTMRRELFVEAPLVHPSVALRTSDLRRLGGYRAYDGPEDYDLWLRAAALGMRFGKLPEVLLDWRDSPARLTRTDPRYAPARFLSRKLESLLEGPLGGGREAVVWGAGAVGKAWGRALRAAGVPLLAFVEVDVRKLGQRIHGARVVSTVEAAAFSTALHLAAVGQRGARARIREEARRVGLPAPDVVAVA